MSGDLSKPAPARPRKWVPRYRIVHLMVLPVLLVFLLAWLDSKALLPTHKWSETRTMAIDFEVTDGSRPLDGVVIEVFEPGGEPRASGRTGPDGRASLVGEFAASGTAGMFGKKNDARIQPFWYTLNRAGYQPGVPAPSVQKPTVAYLAQC
jgi:hypothetical protein